MVRDSELVQKILSSIEAREAAHGGISPESIEGYNPEVVSYHMCLMERAGLIKASCHKSANASFHCFASSLTLDGHEFLDKIRNETVLTNVKSKIKT